MRLLCGFHVCASHPQSKLFASGLLCFHHCNNLTAIHDGNTIRERHDLIQLGGDEQDSDASVAHLYDLAMDIFNRADIQSAGGLVGYHQFYAAAKFTRNDHLLLVTSREFSCVHKWRWRAHIECADESARIFIERLWLNHTTLANRRVIVIAKRHVIGNTVTHYQAMALAVFRNVSKSRFCHDARRFSCDVMSANEDLASSWVAQACKRF